VSEGKGLFAWASDRVGSSLRRASYLMDDGLKVTDYTNGHPQRLQRLSRHRTAVSFRLANIRRTNLMGKPSNAL
jgi:hypothetical protein